MRDCKQCGKPVDGDPCPHCGHAENAAQQKNPTGQRGIWQCADVDSKGNRCAAAGTFSASTKGAEAWYCHMHFGPFRGRYGVRPSSAGAQLARDALESLAERLALQNQAG